MRQFSRYLEDGRFTLRTDNRALTWLNNIKNGKGKLHRWAIYLRSFNFKVEHIVRKHNDLSDALLRQPDDNYFSDNTQNIESLLPLENRPPVAHVYLASAIGHELQNEIIDSQRLENPSEIELSCYLQPTQTLRASRGPIFLDEPGRPPRLYVPFECRDKVIDHFHKDSLDGHPDALETVRAIHEHYFWPKLSNDIRYAVERYPDCSLSKASKPLAKGTRRARRPFAPWDTVAVDLLGMYPRTIRDKRYILVVTDLLFRWTEAFAINNSETITIA